MVALALMLTLYRQECIRIKGKRLVLIMTSMLINTDGLYKLQVAECLAYHNSV